MKSRAYVRYPERLAAAILEQALEDLRRAQDETWARRAGAETSYPLAEFQALAPGLGRADLVRRELAAFFDSEWYRELLELARLTPAQLWGSRAEWLRRDRRRTRRCPGRARDQLCLPGFEPAGDDSGRKEE